MNKTIAIKYIGHTIGIGDSMSLIGWQLGFEPMFVKVYHESGICFNDIEDAAMEYLIRIGWSMDKIDSDYFFTEGD